MSTEILAEEAAHMQSPERNVLVSQYEEAKHALIIASTLAHHAHGPGVALKDLPDVEQQRLLELATVALRANGPLDLPATYLAADALVARAAATPLLGSRARRDRMELVAIAGAVIRTYYRGLAGERPGTMRYMQQLCEADRQAAEASLPKGAADEKGSPS